MRTPILSLLLASSFLLGAAACGSDPSIVATWRELPHPLDPVADPEAERSTWTFGEDGRVTVVEDGNTMSAEYSIEGEALRLVVQEPEETLTIDLDVVLTDDRLLYGAMFPVGDADGFVATWRGDFTLNGQVMQTTIDLRQDQSASLTRTFPGTEPETLTGGTWRSQGDAVEMTFPDGDGITTTYRSHLLDGGMGGPLFERL